MLARQPRTGRARSDIAPQMRSFVADDYLIFYEVAVRECASCGFGTVAGIRSASSASFSASGSRAGRAFDPRGPAGYNQDGNLWL